LDASDEGGDPVGGVVEGGAVGVETFEFAEFCLVGCLLSLDLGESAAEGLSGEVAGGGAFPDHVDALAVQSGDMAAMSSDLT
jgi:hypothetical protein